MRRSWTIAVVLALTSACAWCDEIPKTITVPGTATVHVTPDRAVITAGVMRTAATAADARAEANKTANAILAAIRQVGIPDADIQTAEVRASIVWGPATSSVSGFAAERDFTVTIRDINKAGAVFDAAANAGANRIWGPDFQSAQSRKYKDQARKLAVRAAMEKAQLLASEAGVKVGRARQIKEIPESEWTYDNSGSNSNANAGSRGGHVESDDGNEQTPVPAGQIELQARVEMVFELKD